MRLDESDYPYLIQEHTWAWGPVKTRFVAGEPTSFDLVSNVNIAPFDDSGWLIVRQEIGWGIVGGILEPGENYLDALKRELHEYLLEPAQARPFCCLLETRVYLCYPIIAPRHHLPGIVGL